MREWLLSIALGILAGGMAFAIFVGAAGKPRSVIRVQQETLLPGIQVRLDRARLGVNATIYLLRSLTIGGFWRRASFGRVAAKPQFRVKTPV